MDEMKMTCVDCRGKIRTHHFEDGGYVHHCDCEGDDGVWHWVMRKAPKTNMGEPRY